MSPWVSAVRGPEMGQTYWRHIRMSYMLVHSSADQQTSLTTQQQQQQSIYWPFILDNPHGLVPETYTLTHSLSL